MVKRVLLGGGVAFVIKSLGAGCAFLAQIFLARWLGTSEFGVFTYVLAWVQILMLAGKFGLDTASLKFAGEYLGREDGQTLGRFVGTARPLVFGGAALVALMAGIVLQVIPSPGVAGSNPAWIIGLVLIPLGASMQLRGATLRGLGSVAAAMGPVEVGRPTIVAAVVGLAMVTRILPAPTAATGLGIYLGATAGMLLVLEWLQWHRHHLVQAVSRSKTEIGGWLVVAAPLMLMSGMHLVMSRTDLIMLGTWNGTDTAGIYGAVGRSSLLVVFCVTAVNAIAAPMISRLHASGEHRQLRRILSASTLAILAVAIPASVLMIVFRHWILSWFGPEFGLGADALMVFALAQLVNAPFGLAGFTATMTGLERYAARTLTIAVVVNIALNAVLIHAYGMVGAAVATAISRLAWNLSLVWKIQSHMGIRWLSVVTGRYLRRGR